MAKPYYLVCYGHVIRISERCDSSGEAMQYCFGLADDKRMTVERRGHTSARNRSAASFSRLLRSTTTGQAACFPGARVTSGERKMNPAFNPPPPPPPPVPSTPTTLSSGPTATFTNPNVDGAKVSNPIKVEGTTNGKIVQIKACGHNLHAGAKVENGKFEAIMPTFPTGPFQLEAWVDGQMLAAVKIDVQE